jgi:probable rRNA maturation factor
MSGDADPPRPPRPGPGRPRPAGPVAAARARRRPKPGLAVTLTDGRGRAVRVPGLARWLAGLAPARARGEVAVAIVSDARMRSLNRDHRGRDVATDVLSFPSTGGEPFEGHPTHLGDIVLARGVAARQARAAGHALGVELRVLALHGLLHLLGYDHERDGGVMRRVERRLRRKGGLPAGLIERGPVR